MCGIYGVLFPSDPRISTTGMRDALRHRGPDDAGEERLDDGILGHLRLSIIDLSPAGHEPMWDTERRVCITYNGEVYNFEELRAECESAGIRFRGHSDTEVILGQYLLHGENAFDRLDGMFAFCLYDAARRTFYLVRDPMGIKPLYYAETSRGLFFASELGALLRSGEIDPDVDRTALSSYLQLDFVPSPMSMVAGVKKLPGGSLLRIRRGETISESRFTSLDRIVTRSGGSQSFDDDVAEFGRRFRKVVSRQLVADVPVGVFLSGGIDSSIVASVASEVSSRRISTFSIAFREESFDESKYFDEVAAHIGSEHHTEVLDSRSMMDIVGRLPEITSEPLADGSIFPTYLLSQFTRMHVEVALSGDGADELFAGYPTYRAARLGGALAILPKFAIRSAARAADSLLPVSHANFSFDFKVRKFLNGIDRDPLRRNLRWLGTFAPDEIGALVAGHEPCGDLASTYATGVDGKLEQLLRLDQRLYMQDGVLVKVDRASMAHALEVRVPFLDHEIVEFARTLPADRKLHRGEFKRILKAFGRDRLPASVLARPKKGFGAPLASWFAGELRPWVEEVLDPAAIAREGFFRPDVVQTLVREHVARKRDHRKKLFNLIAFVLWYRWARDVTAKAKLERL